MSVNEEQSSVRVLISEDEITSRMEELALEISRDYEGKDLVLVCVLKGSMVFFADLARKITIPLRFDYICVSSYGDGSESGGGHELRTDLNESVSGRHVRRGMRQSIPSSSIESCAGDIDTLPSFATGQTKRPRSRRLENRQAPC